MSNITPYDFEGASVRALEIDGEPWFVGKDVAEALGYSDPTTAIRSHCKGVQKLHPLQTPGGRQDVRVLSEPDVLRLIVNSTLPAAERFERWVFEEVLPSIRNTGSYAATGLPAALPAPTQDKVSSILMIGEAIQKVPGVRASIAMAATLTCIQENTGLTTETMRRALPASNEPTCSLNATQLGKQLGLSARTVNQRLALHGLQARNERDEWELTEPGRAWGEALPFSRNGHSGYQILWNPGVADMLKQAA